MAWIMGAMAVTMMAVLVLLLTAITTTHGLSSSPLLALSPDQLKVVAQNLLAISGHIQNPELYDASWAQAAIRPGFGSKQAAGLIASRSVEAGEVLSLFPIHAVGLQKLGSQDGTDFVVFDSQVDGPYFRTKKRSPHQLAVDETWLVDVNPDRPDIQSAWMAHLCQQVPKDSNCCILPLAHPAFCGLVSTRGILEGERLCRPTSNESMESEMVQKTTVEMLNNYAAEIQELQSYMRMAYPQLEEKQEATPPPREGEAISFHPINLSYDGLSSIHKDPNMYQVQDFLTPDECQRLMEKARSHLIPCVTKDPKTGEVRPDDDRTSTNANIPQREIPTIIQKLVSLLNCQENQLEIVQILRYTKGEQFKPHTDGFSGPTTACGFEQSGRLVTIFCYLNTVNSGGETRFTELELSVQPKQGSAVIHFPTNLQLEQDLRTEHEGAPAKEEKWLLVTWLWKDARTDARYAEDKLPSLSDEII